tara:strand:+ start:152 stop:442 length:291 start_codon:yes stop_codon:yes gene_type:complete
MENKHTKGIASYKESSPKFISGFVYTEVDAQLIADSFNVTNETGMTPRELQKSHDELLEALVSIKRSMHSHPDCEDGSEFSDMVSIANQAIKNAKP